MDLLVYPDIQEPALRCTSIVIIETNMSRDRDLPPNKEEEIRETDVFLTLPLDDIAVPTK